MASESLAAYAVHTIGGGWGEEQFDEKHTVQVAVVRGTDIPKIAIGDMSTVPRRWETPRKVESRLLRPNDIVIEVSGGSPTSGQHTGRALFVTKEVIDQLGGAVIPASFCRLLRLDDSKVDPRYVTYQIAGLHFSGEIGQFENQSTGLANFQFQKFIDSVSPDIADISEQHQISDVLSCLDVRIRHNRALAANLEATAQRLFKSWFVDFDPVRALAAGEKPVGLADDIAALFPDRFVESEIGDVPEGWSVGKISDFSTNVRAGCTPSQFSAEDFYVGLEHFDRRCLTLWDGGNGDDATSNKSRFAKGDLLFGKLRPYFHKVAVAPMDGICSTDILVIRCADKACREFMYFTLFQDNVIQYVSDASGGTRMPRTNWETLAGYDCVVPPKALASVFGEIVAPMIETMMQCVAENSALTELRDLLLPRLISGKLRVEDAETMIEEAVA